MSGKPFLRMTFEQLKPENIHTDHAGRDLDEGEALAFAQLIKRLGWNEFRANASSEAEAHLMSEAVTKVWSALRNAGLAPR